MFLLVLLVLLSVGFHTFFKYILYSFLILMTLIRKRGSLKADVNADGVRKIIILP
jgi:hypothetical protein